MQEEISRQLTNPILKITILPPFQRSYVNTNAVGLLLHYLLDNPSQGGLGLRRAVWQANADNAKSIAAATRLGWHFEGIARWQRVLPKGKMGLEVRQREEDVRWGLGRSTAVLSMCWDDWVEGGKREFVRGLMDK
jgi:RimJ/RimL family protein N-acetyltransferase